MKVYKFGGASVKDAEGIKNVARVLQSQGFEQCVLVVSAMGKTTNALEKVVELYFDKADYQALISEIKQNHLSISAELFIQNHQVFTAIEGIFEDMQAFLQRNRSPNYSFVYDQIVSAGEMISSKILSLYLNDNQFTNDWLDARDYIKTDSTYREGVIDWEQTNENISQLDAYKSYVTQGFIGSQSDNFTVTLGREGSDYTAAVFAFCLNADLVTIWKDVPGVMTGDPRKFQNVSLLSNISYEEAIEMAYYGASVIHPKTLQPLQQKNIPFYVKSFLEPEEPGTKVGETVQNKYEESYILKENQHLMRIATRDFSFIAEDHMSQIFALMAKYKIKISLMQNSAISLALCLEDKYGNLDELLTDLNELFETEIIRNVALFTVRNADLQNINNFYEGKNILLEQISRNTIQVVTN